MRARRPGDRLEPVLKGDSRSRAVMPALWMTYCAAVCAVGVRNLVFLASWRLGGPLPVFLAPWRLDLGLGLTAAEEPIDDVVVVLEHLRLHARQAYEAEPLRLCRIVAGPDRRQLALGEM